MNKRYGMFEIDLKYDHEKVATINTDNLADGIKSLRKIKRDKFD